MADINGIPYVEATDLVSAYPGTSLALATELDTQLGSKLDYPAGGADGDALIKDGTDALWGSAGKIRQVVRATDSTQRSTTSTSFVDVTGMSVTITPQKSDSAIIIVAIFSTSLSSSLAEYRITDSSNNAISGFEAPILGSTVTTRNMMNGWAYSTPAVITPVTFKLRFRASTSGTVNVNNHQMTGQMYAIEVSA